MSKVRKNELFWNFDQIDMKNVELTTFILATGDSIYVFYDLNKQYHCSQSSQAPLNNIGKFL